MSEGQGNYANSEVLNGITSPPEEVMQDGVNNQAGTYANAEVTVQNDQSSPNYANAAVEVNSGQEDNAAILVPDRISQEQPASYANVEVEMVDMDRNNRKGDGTLSAIDYENSSMQGSWRKRDSNEILQAPNIEIKDNIRNFQPNHATSTTGESTGVFLVPHQDASEAKPAPGGKMLFEIEDVPPWYLTIFLGFQHYLMMAGATLSIPLVLMPKMCMEADNADMANIISTYLFVSGMVTILQTTFGIRLPVIQGGSFAFIVSALSILDGEQWKCDRRDEININPTEKWQIRMREIQGAIIMASIFQMILGFFGVFGYIMQRITPITLASSVITIGLSLFTATTGLASEDWVISTLTIVLVILFSQYLRQIKISIPFTVNVKKTGPVRYPMFQLFPVLLAIICVWGFCGILSAAGVYSPEHKSYTGAKWNIVRNSKLFRVPYPFQWGYPTFSISSSLGFLSAVFAGVVESLGEYRAISRIVRAPSPPKHAINRGVFMEGVGCFLMGLFGTGNGTTSYSENTGALSITKVGSRRVIQTAGFLMMVFSMLSFLGAFFMSLPNPIIGGILCVTFSMIVAIGVSNLQNVDLTSTRNIFIVGFSVFFGLAMSKWMETPNNKQSIKTGFDSLDETIRIFLSTGMFLAACISFFLDNTIPGTPEERGLVATSTAWQRRSKIGMPIAGEIFEIDPLQSATGGLGGDLDGEEVPETTYDLPFGMKFLQKHKKFTSIFPISPTFEGFSTWKLFSGRRAKQDFPPPMKAS